MSITIHSYIQSLIGNSENGVAIINSKGRFSFVHGKVIWLENPTKDQKLPMAIALKCIYTELEKHGDSNYLHRDKFEILRRKIQSHVERYNHSYCWISQLFNFLRYGSVNRAANRVFAWIECHSRSQLDPLERVFADLEHYEVFETENELMSALEKEDEKIIKIFAVLNEHKGWAAVNKGFVEDLWGRLKTKEALPHFWYRLKISSDGIIDDEEIEKKYTAALKVKYPEYFNYVHREEEGIIELDGIPSDILALLKNFVQLNQVPGELTDSKMNELRKAAERFKIISLIKFCCTY